jgi:hypothetical protein
MRRRLTPLLLLAAAACADTTTTGPSGTPNLARIKEAEDSHGGTPFMVTLLPRNEVPGPGDPNSAASGVVYLTLNSGQEEICYRMSFSGLSTPAFAAHIHPGTSTQAQPPLVTLPLGGQMTETSTPIAQCVFVPREVVKAIRKNPENYYINVHTIEVPVPPGTEQPGRPGGAIRGQLEKTQGSNVNHG